MWHAKWDHCKIDQLFAKLETGAISHYRHATMRSPHQGPQRRRSETHWSDRQGHGGRKHLPHPRPTHPHPEGKRLTTVTHSLYPTLAPTLRVCRCSYDIWHTTPHITERLKHLLSCSTTWTRQWMGPYAVLTFTSILLMNCCKLKF